MSNALKKDFRTDFHQKHIKKLALDLYKQGFGDYSEQEEFLVICHEHGYSNYWNSAASLDIDLMFTNNPVAVKITRLENFLWSIFQPGDLSFKEFMKHLLRDYSKIKRDFFFDDILEDLNILGFYKPELLAEITIKADDQKKTEFPQKIVAFAQKKPVAKKNRTNQIDHPLSNKEEASIERELCERIFIVHGHDIGLKESVARFIEKLKLTPVILHEQPNLNRAIFEKLEDYSDVGFAIVILTPDDKGKRNNDGVQLKTRARQNVILELGYFIGKLDRKKVCVIHKDVDELPSDIHGILYIDFDPQGAWKMKLIKELRAVGYKIDTNAVV